MNTELAQALKREDALKVEMALATGREAMIRMSRIEKDLSELKSKIEGISAAVAKLVNDMRPDESD